MFVTNEIKDSTCETLVKKSVFLLLTLVLLGIGIAPTWSSRNLRAHFIANVQWHDQLNALACGPAALEIVFDYFGPDIDQKEIFNVARTSSMGTWTSDIERAGHFSYLSCAQGRFFPSLGPDSGFQERRLGYASFSYSSGRCWLDELKELVDDDIPVIVLMKYTPTGGGGHYRVVIGYDDSQQLVYFSDPWGRDTNHLTNRTGLICWSYADFEKGWNYTEYGSNSPYFGVAIMPWQVDLNVKGDAKAGSVIAVTASVQYPCPGPFNDREYPARETKVQITLPEGASLLGGSNVVSFGTLNAGNTVSVTWRVSCEENVIGRVVLVSAWGIVSGSVPEAYWNGENVYYQPYTYDDTIGGEAQATLRARYGD
jgi:Peptidase_C39 like family